MYNQKKILAIIPARGGSNKLPRKNILPLLGKPLITWTIEEAKKVSYIDKLIVSTDDPEIAELSRKNNAEVPFLRPEHLAMDDSRGIDVVIHSIKWFKSQDNKYDIILLLQPTSPLRSAEDIIQSIHLLKKNKVKAVISVCEVEHSPCWMNTLPVDLNMNSFMKPEIQNKNRQELPTYYRINGAIYIAYSYYILKNSSFLGSEAYAYIMPKERSIDIDSQQDIDLAEYLLRKISYNLEK